MRVLALSSWIAAVTFVVTAHAAESDGNTRQSQCMQSANFRVYSGKTQVAADLLTRLEEYRQDLQSRWCGTPTRSWSPKCDIVIHDTPEAFRRQTGQSPEMLAFSTLEIGQGRVWVRRIQIRGDLAEEFQAVLEHEVTHIVLADHFREYPIPRWLDEGAAVAEERSPRRSRLDDQLSEAIELGRQPSLHEVLSLAVFPSDRVRSDLLYAQSASFVDFLLSRQSHDTVVDFARYCRSTSPREALRRYFQFRDVQEAEQAWLAWARSNAKLASVEPEPATLVPKMN